MTEVKNIRCEIHCQNGESIHVAFPAVPGICEREAIYVEVSENRSYGCRYGQIRLNMRQGALRKEKPIRVSLPTVQSPEKITAMYMLNDWWTRPAFVEGFQEIPARTQVAFLKYPDRFACLVPMVGKSFKTYLEAGTEQEVCLEMLSSLDGQTEVDEPLYVLGEADTLADAVHKVFAWLTKRMGIRTREQRRMPEMFRSLGWCSWDAFYREITEEKVRQKAHELVEKKIPVRWMLMDDGWLSTKGELLCDFAPEPAKFPNGFGKMIADIKAESDIRWFGVWHALCGYWQGVAPESKLEGQEHANLYRTADGKIMPNPLTGEGFYRDWYEKLHADGIDFVKVDGQSSFWSFAENSLPIGPAAKGMHQALEGGASYMDGAIINCMGMAIENILSRPTSAISRNSDDFVPNKENGFVEHLLQNAYNSVYHDELYYCDWDMFWTKHEDAVKHSLLRAISGGPIYVSDQIGDTNPDVLKPLTYHNGEILMMDHSAKPTEDCMFSDPMKTGVLKLHNTASWGSVKKGGGIAVYNLTDGIQDFSFRPADIPQLEESDNYWVYDYFAKNAFSLGKQESYESRLDLGGFGWFVLLPKGKYGTCLGLLDKYVGFTAVESILESDSTQTVVVKESGTLGWLSEKEPQKVMVNSVDVTSSVKKNDFLYEITLPEGPHKTVLSFVW